jgi:hypothetical protein
VSINNDVSHYVYILTYTIRIMPQPTMKLSIHNQCSVFKLINRGYFSNGADWHEKPNEKVNNSILMSASLMPFLSTFEGVLAYELQRNYEKSSELFESTYILFFVAWKSEGYKKFRMFTHLIEHNEYIDWNEIKLEEYYQRYANRLNTYTRPIKDTWLISDGTVLKTELGLDFTKRDGVLSIIISEGIRDNHIKKSIWISPER